LLPLFARFWRSWAEQNKDELLRPVPFRAVFSGGVCLGRGNILKLWPLLVQLSS